MRCSPQAFAAAFILIFSASARAQVRVEAVAPVVSPAGVGIVPRGLAPAVLAPSALTVFSAPSLSAPLRLLSISARVPEAFAAAALPAPASVAAAASASPSAGPERNEAAAVLAAVEPDTPASCIGRWSLSKSAEGAAWRFRDLPFLGSRLWDGSRRLEMLGAGAMGAVFVHPSHPGSVVKVARRGYADAAGDFMSSDEDALDFEDRDLSRLAELGAAPRPLARLAVSGRPASERERVRGSTVARLQRAGLFGPRERALVHDLLDRVADGGYVARDLNLGNIMIGRRDGDSEERAWIVDTLGLSTGGGLDAAARKARMLAEPVPWLAVQGFGLGKPLGAMLDGAPRRGRPLMAESRTPLPWSKPRRYATLAGLLAALAVLPALAHAALPAAPSALGLLPSWPALAGLSIVLALAGIPARLFAHRLAPWIMTRSKDQGDALTREAPVTAVPSLAIAAAIEEALFRGLAFLGGAVLLLPLLPPLAAFSAAALASSLVFALVHGYGSVWTRVVGGLIYAGALLATGSFVLPVATHFAFNLSLYVYGRYLRP